MYMIRFFKLINRDNIYLINNLLGILMVCLPILIGGIKYIYSYRTKKLLESLNLTKTEIRNLKYYIETYGQKISPIDEKELLNNNVLHFNLIKFFIDDVFKKDSYGRYFIILADSGMGKTTFLQMLFLRYKRKIIKSKKIFLYALNNRRELEGIRAIRDKNRYIILLDALDEDSYAIEEYQKRIDEIINVTQDFYKVIITCRTQFFPDKNSEPKDISLSRYGSGSKRQEFYKIYISAFNNKSINKYLKKRYKRQTTKIYKAKEIISKSSDLMVIPMLLTFMDDLLDNDKAYSCTADIYKVIIDKWIDREVEHEKLRNFTHLVVLYMFQNNIQFLKINDIAQICKEEQLEIINPILARTRSLLVRNRVGEYKFLHRSVYEYLISYEAVYVDESMRKKILNMDKSFNKTFFRELSYEKLRNGFKNLEFLDFSSLKITNIDMNDVNFYGANFEYAYLAKVNLCGANLEYSNLGLAILSSVNLKKANLKGADLCYAILKKADLSESKLVGANLKKADLKKADLEKANLTKANLESANLSYAVLEEANLERTNLEDSILIGANLKNTNLKDTNFLGANLEDASITDANISNIKIDNYNRKYFIAELHRQLDILQDDLEYLKEIDSRD